jgi:hypothetical protein
MLSRFFKMATLLPNDEISSNDLRGYRVFIFSHDHPHPPHVHFGKGRRYSSWDIVSAECSDSDHFSKTELREQRRILVNNREAIWRSWYDVSVTLTASFFLG